MSLNDPQWGRGGGADSGPGRGDGSDPDKGGNPPPGKPAGPPDLDELWRDFNRRLNGLLGGRRGGSGGDGGSGGGRGGGFRPDAKGAGIGVVAIVAALLVIWLSSGFYIVQEGQVGVVTTFGKYTESTTAGFRWRAPWPIQSVEIVDVLKLQTVEIGARGRADRLKEALMLTDDQNIVDIQFTVQYRIKEGPNGARDFLFNSRNPTEAVTQTAETAMREVVGRQMMDKVLYESRQEIADQVKARMQEMLDRYGTGILVSAVAIQNAQPPEQVQAAFDDAVKASQDRERQINEGQAYANDVVPKARGAAARLTQESEGYRTRVVDNAQGDAARFEQVRTEYEKAPAVTRERMYLDTMQQIFASVTKVLVDTKNGTQLLNLPLDRLMQQTAPEPAAAPRTATSEPAAPTVPAPATAAAAAASERSRDNLRTRETR
jgi:membrane protease subunit HflK